MLILWVRSNKATKSLRVGLLGTMLLRRTRAWDKSFFTLDTQVFIKINSVHGNLKHQMKLDLCTYEALSYTYGAMETVSVGVAINYH